MTNKPFDITAGERAHAIEDEPFARQPIFDPTDPRCETRPRGPRAASAPQDPTAPSARRAARLRSDERRRPAS